MTPDPAAYLPWLILRDIPAVGTRIFHRLLTTFGCPENVLAASPATLERIPGLSKTVIQGIRNWPQHRAAAQAELDRILDHGFRILTCHDPMFPPLLAEIPDPPPILTGCGTVDIQAPCVAIVGARQASAYGMQTARDLSRGLAERGVCIVSGMARGIDTAAHAGALDADGKTIAVLGSGLKKIYPRENRRLFNDIQARGAVLSEFKLDTAPYPYNFPMRNRIIAGLSCGTIVVEAARKSGSLITARLAGEYNREVFAVPGNVRSHKSRGTHWLLKQGAKLVETVTDVVEELTQFIHEVPGNDLMPPPDSGDVTGQTDTCRRILSRLDAYPRHIDQIIDAVGMDSGTVAAALLDLELSGAVVHHPGNYFSISKQ